MLTICCSGTAQHFHLADRILVLEDFKIREQGSWDELQIKQEQIEKIITNDGKPAADESNQALSTSKTQLQKQPTAKNRSDKTRQDGDSALYGNVVFLFRRYWLIYASILYKINRAQEFRTHDNLLVALFNLCDAPAILA
jgi:hypothetical protein